MRSQRRPAARTPPAAAPAASALPVNAPLVALLALAAALAVAIVVTTPWDTLDGLGLADVPAPPAPDFTAAELAREDAFHAAVRPPAYASLLVSLGVALLLGFTPLGARVVERIGGRRRWGWAWRVAAGAAALSLLGRLAALPFDAGAEVALRRFGLSTQTWPEWLLDQAKAWGLSAGLLVVALLPLWVLIRRSPVGWWAPAALGGAGLVVAVSFGYPLVVEPVFNRFEPMPPSALRTSLVDLAERDGVPVTDVLVADASRRTTSLNAYVSGFGSTRRIVVYDTLLRSASEPEVRHIVAHELGHAKRNDVLRGTLIGALGVAAAVVLLGTLLTSGRLGPALLRRAGTPQLGDPRSVPLLLALIALVTAAAGPVQGVVSRRVEARADLHALQLTHDAPTAAAIQRRLATSNLADLDPAPAVYALFASHPTAPQRIALTRQWAAEAGAPGVPPLAP